MTYEEFTQKMRELGYDDDHINDCIEHAKEVSKYVKTYPLEKHLIELPTDFPAY